MKSPSQFIALICYHIRVSPWIWIFPLVGASQAFIQMNRYYNNLQYATSIYSPMWWMPLMVAAFLFHPEIFLRNRWVTAQTQAHTQCYNPEFLITRALDRSSLFWSRLTVFWLLIGSAVIVWIVAGIITPSITLELFNKAGDAAVKGQYYLQQLPGSFIEKTGKGGEVTIQVPEGGLYFKATAAAIYAAFAVLGQAFIFLISRLRYRVVIFWIVFFLGCFSPVLLLKVARSPVEILSLFVINHPMISLSAILAGAVMAALIGARIHRSLEYP